MPKARILSGNEAGSVLEMSQPEFESACSCGFAEPYVEAKPKAAEEPKAKPEPKPKPVDEPKAEPAPRKERGRK